MTTDSTDKVGFTSSTACFVGLLLISALLNLPLLYFTFNSNLWALVFYDDTIYDRYPVRADRNMVLVNATGGIAQYEAVNVTQPQLTYSCDDLPAAAAGTGNSMRTAVIFPFRDREMHLKLALSPIHKHMMDQNLSYELYVVEQVDEKPFNRAKLFNVGVREGVMKMEMDKAKKCNVTSLKYCLILHDIDLLPLNPKIPYSCNDRPTLLSSGISKFGYKMPYDTYFGGAVAISLDQFKAINGMSNEFWGWGGEDDDFYRRMKSKGLQPTSLSQEQGKYQALSHKQAKASKDRFKVLEQGRRQSFRALGLMQSSYVVKQIIQTEIFTHIKVTL